MGLDEALRRLKALPPEQKTAAAKGLSEGAAAIAAAVSRAAPVPQIAAHVGSGPTPPGSRKGLLDGIAEEGLSFQIWAKTSGKAGQGVYNPYWFEFGVAEHPEAAKHAKVMHFKGAGDDAGFRGEVDHPAVRAQPFFWPTIRAQKRPVVNRMLALSRAATKRALSR